jgi:hypothetical protein
MKPLSARCISPFLFSAVFFPMLVNVPGQGAPDQPQSKAPAIRFTDLKVTPDIDQLLAKIRPVKMPFNESALTAKERQMVEKLLDACQLLDSIYWRQIDPEGLQIYQSLVNDNNPEAQKVARLLYINGGRWDLVNDNKPFVGSEPIPPGRAFYPKGLTREQIEQYVKQHPGKKAEIYSPYTIIEREGNELVGVPYHLKFKKFLEPMAKDLREAASLSDDRDFANFLRLRADALLSDDYYSSDIAWLDLNNPKFDIIFAPYETYDDELLGVKATYGASVLVRNEAESRKLAMYQRFVPEIQDALPISGEDKPSKKGHATPMEVMDAPFRSGDLGHGYQAVADNLPNDARIHQQKGSKKIFFKNFGDARVEYVILPVAERVMRPDQAKRATAAGYLSATLMHEIAHGLGPVYSRTPSGQLDIREATGHIFAPLEEAKADVVGMYGLQVLLDKGVLPKDRIPEFYTSYVAGIFRSVRFGVAEAHGRAEMMEFNYLSERGAIQLQTIPRTMGDNSSDRPKPYVVNYDKMPDAIASLAKELLTLEATGDRAGAEAWFNKYDKMPDELKQALATTNDIPVDVEPIFSFPKTIQ